MSIVTFDIRVKRPRGAAAAPSLRLPLLPLLLLFALGGASAARAELPKKLIAGLSASSSKVRIVAVSNVARSKDPSARGLLEPLLADSDAAVRAAVVDGLGRLADPAALAALESMRSDPDPTVQRVLARTVPVLRALVVNVYLGGAKDLSGSTIPGLAEKLHREVKAALSAKLGPAFILVDDPTMKSYGATPLNIRSVTRSKDGRTSFLEIKCELTLVEMPGNILRAALSSTAAVGVEGEINKKLEAELANDAIAACAPEMASDFVAYLKEHARR